MKFPMRIFGEIKGVDLEKIDTLVIDGLSPFELRDNQLEIEYEGPCFDIEPLLDNIVQALNEKGQGHVDCIDHENWEVLRYRISQGSWTCKKINPDNALEACKWQ